MATKSVHCEMNAADRRWLQAMGVRAEAPQETPAADGPEMCARLRGALAVSERDLAVSAELFNGLACAYQRLDAEAAKAHREVKRLRWWRCALGWTLATVTVTEVMAWWLLLRR
jgi:hypothetical protein